MRHLFDQLFEWLTLELTQCDFRHGCDVKIDVFSPRPANKVRRQQQANNLRPPILHRARKRSYSGHNRCKCNQLIATPYNRLTSLKSFIGLNFLEPSKLVIIAPRAHGPVPDRARSAFFTFVKDKGHVC